jgi:hypothetical protein
MKESSSMGHDWTIPELYEIFERMENLEYLADSIPHFFPEPMWIPCLCETVRPTFFQDGRETIQVRLALLPSRYADIAGWLRMSEGIEITGLDQIRNRLRPRKYD